VAKTWSVNTGELNGLIDSGGWTDIVDGTYGPFIFGNVTFTVDVSGNFTTYTVIGSSGLYTVGDTIGTINSSQLGGALNTTTSNVIIDLVDPSGGVSLDLTKTINKLANGSYTLANGVEGQIMYLVRQTGSVDANILVQVARARVNGSEYVDIVHYPFSGGGDSLTTLIFTDGYWQSTNGAWDI
jgi:hypothetical protein